MKNSHLAAVGHGLDGVDGEVRQHLLDLPGVDLGDGLLRIGREDQLGPSASRQSNRACRSSVGRRCADRPAICAACSARAKSRSCRMIVVILSASSLIAAALCAICSASSLPEPINPARPATTFSGVPSSWAMPEASRPTVFKRSAWRSCSRAVIRAAVSWRSLVCDSARLRAHGVEVLGQFRQFIAGTKVYGAFQVPAADPPGFGNQQFQRPPHQAEPRAARPAAR